MAMPQNEYLLSRIGVANFLYSRNEKLSQYVTIEKPEFVTSRKKNFRMAVPLKLSASYK
jgi:hypothetical protein